MRNGLTGLASVALLGGVLAVGGTSMQERTAAPAEDAAAGDVKLKAAATYVITPDTIDCTTFINENTCQASLVIRVPQNAETRALSLGATLTTPSGNAVEPKTIAIIRPDGSTVTTLDLSGKSAEAIKVQLTLPSGWRQSWPPSVASGVLGILSNDRYEGTPKRLRVLAPSGSVWQTRAILGPAALALLVAIGVAVYLQRAKVGLLDRMGAPNWRASESWSSNLTIGAGLTNGVLTLAVISDLTVFMTKPAYGVVTMLLSALVTLAPIVYGLFRKARTAERAEPNVQNRLALLQPAKEQSDGYVVVFLAAGALTLWASGGQLLTFALLIGELWSVAALTTPVAVVIVGLVLVVFVALFVYGGKSMATVPVKAQEALEAQEELNAHAAQKGREGVVITPARAPAWSLL